MYESTLLMSTGEASVMRFDINLYDCVALYLQLRGKRCMPICEFLV